MQPLERFAREHDEYHDISDARCRERQRELRRLSEFAGKPLEECEASDLRSYIAADSDRLNVNTLRKNLNLVKPFFAWAWEAGLIDAERFMAIQRVAAPRKANANGLPRPYSRKDLDRFYEQLDKRLPIVEERFWKRWRNGTSPYRRIQPHAMRIQVEAVVALALHCGLRRSEIYQATIDDIHYDNQYVVVRHGKGDRFREVPHTASSREAIRQWLELRSELNPDHDFLWLSLAHKNCYLRPMRLNRFRELLRKTVGDWQLHRFRHTAGTEWLRATKRIEIVQKLLGHARLQQTLGYAELVRDDLHSAVEKAERQFEDAVGKAAA